MLKIINIYLIFNALIIAVGLKKKEKISKTFSNLESIWQEYQIYSYKNKDENKF